MKKKKFHCMLFTGHMIDGTRRHQPRFPAESEELARTMIGEAIAQTAREVRAAGCNLLALAGGASGGDILFHEECLALNIHSELYLALPAAQYIAASVAPAGDDWVRRFNHLQARLKTRVLGEEEEPEPASKTTGSSSLWEHSNRWMVESGLTLGEGGLTLIALWDGKGRGEPGGTWDMVARAREHGADFIHLDAGMLLRP